MKTVLFVRPAHDDVLSYLFYYTKKLLKSAKLKGFKTINKEKEQADKKVVTNVINKTNPIFIMFNGHGDPSVICGHNDKVIIDVKTNSDLLKNKMVYALSPYLFNNYAVLEVLGNKNATIDT